MKKLFTYVLMLCASLSVSVAQQIQYPEPILNPESCTSIMVGKKASADGSVMTSHTCDSNYRTWMDIVPSASYDHDTTTTVYTGRMHTEYAEGTRGMIAKGTLPEARSTYQFLNTAYPCLNEKQLGIGETTITGRKALVNKKGMFMIEELQRIVLQRCTTARDAIRVMGELIEKYGADGVRMGMMLSAPAGNDILFDDALCEQGRNFCNKIWNAFRLVKGWRVDDQKPVPEASRLAADWFESKQNEVAAEVADLFSKYRLSEALMAVYKLFWDEFSSWYLEIIKPAYGEGIPSSIHDCTLRFFDNLLHLLHPFMPFITEEIWQHLYRTEEEIEERQASLMVDRITIDTVADKELLVRFETVKEVISNIRSIRLQKNIAQKEALELQVIGENPVAAFNAVVMKMCNLSSVNVVENKADGAASFMVGTTEYAVPLGNMIDVEAEIARMEAELKHKEGFLQGVLKKLGNEKFVNNAPATVLEMERKKQADAESIIKSLKESIAALKKA